MALAPYTVTALAESDAEGTGGKNIVAGALITLEDVNGNTATIYDDSAGTNPSTAKTTNSNGQKVIYAEAGEYSLTVNGGPATKIIVGADKGTTAFLISSTRNYREGDTVETTGYASAGDGGAVQWRKTADTDTASQSPAQRGDGTLTDATGSVWELAGLEANPLQLGATGDGVTDDTLPLSALFSRGGVISLVGNEYLFSYLEVTSPFSLIGSGSLRHDGSSTPSSSSIDVSASFSAELLRITSAGTGDSVFNLLEVFSDDVKIERLETISDSERDATGGCIFYGNNVTIGEYESVNVVRPLEFKPEVASTVRENVVVGDVNIKNYLRGVSFNDIDGFVLGSLKASERSSFATNSAGQNGLLVQACTNFDIGDLLIENASEHSVRFGGSSDISNFSIGNITTVDSGGCSLKLNVDTGFSVGRGSVGNVVGVRTGEGSNLGNREVVRLTKVSDVSISSIHGLAGCTRCLIVADISNLRVGHVNGEDVRARLIQTDDTQDGSDGNIDGLFVDSYNARMDSGARSAIGLTYGAPSGRSISNVFINDGYATGYSNFLAETIGSNIQGAVAIRCTVGESDPTPAVEDAVDTDLLRLDVQRGGARFSGKAIDIDLASTNSFSGPTLDTSSSPTLKGSHYLTSLDGTPGTGAYGGSYAFSRVGSGRRGAAIAVKQITSDNKENGLSFLVQDVGTTANESIQERMLLKHDGTLNISDLQTFADDAAAGSGGLVQGDLYQTASGEIRIKL